jgi:hypothetical protein
MVVWPGQPDDGHNPYVDDLGDIYTDYPTATTTDTQTYLSRISRWRSRRQDTEDSMGTDES